MTWQPVSFLAPLPGVQQQTEHAFLLRFIILVCSLHLGPSKQTNKQMKKKKDNSNERKKFCRLGDCDLPWREKHAGLIVSEEVDSRLPAYTAARWAVAATEKEEDDGRPAGWSASSAWWLRPCRPASRGNPALCWCIGLSGGGIVHDLGESHRCPVAFWPASWPWAMIITVRTTGRMFTVTKLEEDPARSETSERSENSAVHGDASSGRHELMIWYLKRFFFLSGNEDPPLSCITFYPIRSKEGRVFARR